MELRHTILILDIPRNDLALAQILRQYGMVVTDECRGVPPSTLRWEDNINGAGARTFIWDDRAGVPFSSNNTYTPAYTSGHNSTGNSSRLWGAQQREEYKPPEKQIEVVVQDITKQRQVRLED